MLSLKSRRVRIFVIMLLAGGLLYFLYLVRIILLPFLFGVILAYLFNPLIKFMMGRGFSRQGSLVLLLIGVLNVIVFTGLFLFPLFINELEDLARAIPVIVNSIEEFFTYLEQEYKKIHLPRVIKDSLDNFLRELENYIVDLLRNITEMILNSFSYIFSILLAPIITYYLLKDIDRLKRTFIKQLPRSRRKFCYRLIQEINSVFVGFLRGQIWISFLVGILAAAGLFFLKVRFYLLLGLIAGITNIIPYIGPIIGSIPAIIIALLSAPLRALAVVILFIFIQQIESAVIAPRIMSNKVGLHPLTVIFSLLAGAELMGVWGLLFAVPLAGSLKVISKLLLRHFISDSV